MLNACQSTAQLCSYWLALPWAVSQASMFCITFNVTFLGWLVRITVRYFLHFLLHPSLSEEVWPVFASILKCNVWIPDFFGTAARTSILFTSKTVGDYQPQIYLTRKATNEHCLLFNTILPKPHNSQYLFRGALVFNRNIDQGKFNLLYQVSWLVASS